MGLWATWTKTPPLKGGRFCSTCGPPGHLQWWGRRWRGAPPSKDSGPGVYHGPVSVILVRVCGPVEDRDALHTMVSVLGYRLEWQTEGCGELVAYRGGYLVSSIAATGDVWGRLRSLKRCGTVYP